MRKFNSALLATLVFVLAFANQASAASSLEEYFFESGKIKVVVAVATIVLCGVFFFLFRLERRIKNLENKK
jgi:uncharacterized integral membrane protein